MDNKRFTIQEIERFNDKISNALDNSQCREVLGKFLDAQKNPTLIKTYSLWKEAHQRTSYNEDSFLDIIEEIDDFNINPLYSLSECDHKFAYIKQECARILEKIRPQFILYLHKYYQ